MPTVKTFRGRNGAFVVAQKALKVARKVQRELTPEVLNHRTIFQVDPNTTGSVVDMTSIAQGLDTSARVGRRIHAVSLVATGFCQIHASATHSTLRMTLVRDKSGTTTQPAIADLFQDVTEFRNLKPPLSRPQQRGRFQILADRKYLLDTNNKESYIVNIFKKLNFDVDFTGTAVTDEGKNHIYLFIASSEATNDPVVSVICDVRYTD